MDNYNRLEIHAEDLTIIDENGKKLSNAETIEYLKNKKKELLTIEEELNVGDLVRLKGFSDILMVKKKNTPDFKYCGKLSGTVDRFYMFNQEDIDEVVKKF